jgi:hypothetical protein
LHACTRSLARDRYNSQKTLVGMVVMCAHDTRTIL